jgi:lysozyme family protein
LVNPDDNAYLQAITYAFGNEGARPPYLTLRDRGYVNNPRDPGGETAFGICKRDHPTVDIKNLTFEQADVIAREQYWCGYGQIQYPLPRIKLLDWALNMEGTGRAGEAVLLMQRSINTFWPNVLPMDKKFGPNTILMMNRCDPLELVYECIRQAIIFRHAVVANKPQCEEFLAGWIARDNKLPVINQAVNP